MKHNQRVWLWNELELWVADGLLRRDQAEAIKARYPQPPDGGAPWAVILFAGFGAVMFGLGIILILAFNWEKIHKFGKLGLIFGALLAAHAGGMALRRDGSRWRSLGDALHVLGTMLFGAGIWLVAQVYHIQEHWPNGILVWALGALAMAWALPSTAQGVIAVILLCIWGGGECCAFNTGTPLAPLFILLGAGLLAWRERSFVLLIMTIPAYLLSVSFCLGPHHGHWLIPVILAHGAVLVAAAELTPRNRWFPHAASIFRFFGLTVYLIAAFAFTFKDVQEHYWDYIRWDMTAGVVYWLATAVVAILLWGWALAVEVQQSSMKQLFLERSDRLLIPLFFAVTAILLPLANCSLQPSRGVADIIWLLGVILVNVLYLAQTFFYLHFGCRESRAGITVVGAVMLAAWSLGRYADLFHSLLVRGVVFLALGAGLFVVGLRYARHKQRRQTAESAASVPQRSINSPDRDQC